jgi:hypothetical protein
MLFSVFSALSVIFLFRYDHPLSGYLWFYIAGNRVQVYGSIGPHESNGKHLGQYAVDGDLPVGDTTPLDNSSSYQTQIFDSGLLPENNHSFALTSNAAQTYWFDFIVYTSLSYDDDVELMDSSSSTFSEPSSSSLSSALPTSSATTNRSSHVQLSIALSIALIVPSLLIATAVILWFRRRRLKVRNQVPTAGLFPGFLAYTFFYSTFIPIAISPFATAPNDRILTHTSYANNVGLLPPPPSYDMLESESWYTAASVQNGQKSRLT